MRKGLFVRKLKPRENRALGSIVVRWGATKRKRMALVIRLSDKGKTSRQLAEMTGVHCTTIRRWIKAFNQRGLDSLKQTAKSGRPRKADEKFEAATKEILEKSPGLRAQVLREHLHQATGQYVSLRTVYNVKRRLKDRSKSPPQSL